MWNWLRERQEHCLRFAGGALVDMGSSISMHPKVGSVMAENSKQLGAMSRQSIPVTVVKCLAKDCGPCVRMKMKQGKGEYEFG